MAILERLSSSCEQYIYKKVTHSIQFFEPQALPEGRMVNKK
jgi:hypothetical protein